MFLCALVGPLFPPPPASCLLYVPFLCVRLSCCCFFLFFVPCSSSPLLPRALRVPPALLRATPVPLPCAPSLACLPSHPPSRCQPCLYVCPPCRCRAVTCVCHPRALPLPLPLAPTLSPGPPHPSAPSVPASHPILVAWHPVWGGGGVSVDWTVALPEVWHGCWLPTHHDAPHVPKEHRENVRETLVEFPSLHLHFGAQPHRQRFALRCTS